MKTTPVMPIALRNILLCAGVALLLWLPFQQAIYPVLLMKWMCFALFAAAFNLLLGFTGLLSFGHAALFGVAAYGAGYVVSRFGATPELAILAGTAAGAVTGCVMGALAIRRAGIYFAMITLALAQMVYFLAVQMPQSGGEEGLRMPRGKLFGVVDLQSDTAMYYVVLCVFVLGLLVLYRVIQSPFGEAMKSVRDNEPRAISLGLDAARVKLLAFVLSAAIAGLAGATKAIVFQLASWSDVHWHTSGEVVVMTVLGGIGTFAGPLLGAAVVIGLQNYLANIGSWSAIAIGSVFMLCVLCFRRGIVGELRAAWRRWTRP
ncbi:branched-chain amino acid ABC transporter permease [Lampropedia aestuarii]|uniref:branched-chain amino acid ABC transporter permease n=1 Tax=Lampropedia aestuarii TaxID=2562762 RepID=UPI00246827B7|nr:branched-chain amino acid ABC transporter permease [Lampropedia aestuarii]MDH5856476.1 branched-chain amino acid ABC transporter permease [Lampropedia aestuarii]